MGLAWGLYCYEILPVLPKKLVRGKRRWANRWVRRIRVVKQSNISTGQGICRRTVFAHRRAEPAATGTTAGQIVVTQHAERTDGASHQGTEPRRLHLQTPLPPAAASASCGPGTSEVGNCDSSQNTRSGFGTDVVRRTRSHDSDNRGAWNR